MIILILMITISLAGLAYMFMSTTMSDVTSSAGSTVDTTTSSMLTSFTIESMDVAKVYIRNTGQNPITSLSVYVNDEPATFNVTTPIAAGSVGTVTIYSFIPNRAIIKLTSPSGFSVSKVANPCDKAAGCWDFDEGSGTTAYDSSPNGKDGMLVNGPSWTSGKYGGALSFDGSNDYVSISNIQLTSGDKTVVIVMRPTTGSEPLTAFEEGATGSGQMYYVYNNGNLAIDCWNVGWYYSTGNIQMNSWNSVAYAYNQTTKKVKFYINGLYNSETSAYASGLYSASAAYVGGDPMGSSGNYFNGIIDEVRIYNRAIY